MIVHFSASLRTINDDIGVYRKILFTIREQGCSISNDWVEASWLHSKNKAQNKLEHDWRSFSVNATTGIESAELVIIEASGFSSFGVGYEAALAIRLKKPTLLLIKKHNMKNSYASGLGSDLVTIKAYDMNNLEKVIESFLRDNAVATKDLRFNFVIDQQIHGYLRRKSFQSGKTKAEILRELVIDDMAKS